MKIIVPALILLILLASIPVYEHGTGHDARIAEREIKDYQWDFIGENYHLELNTDAPKVESKVINEYGEWYIYLNVTRESYEFYHELPGGYRYAFNFTYLEYFLTTNDSAIRHLAYSLNYIATAQGFDNLTRLNFILSFVQKAMTYYDDMKTTGFYDYYRFPLETLVYGGGDCEDLALLLATIAHIIGYDVVLFVLNITYNSNTEGHVAVGVHFDRINHSNYFSNYLRDYYIYGGKKYYYMETTASQYKYNGMIKPFYVGVSPSEAGYKVKKLGIVPYKSSTYNGFSASNEYVTTVESQPKFPWFIVYSVIFLAIFIPLFAISYKYERKRCPSCGFEVEDTWNYCPKCGYWLRYMAPKPPEFDGGFGNDKYIK